MLDTNLSQNNVKLAIQLEQSPTKYNKYIVLLKNEFGYNLSKYDLAKVLDTSVQTIDRRIKESLNIPNYLRSSNGLKASYLFPVIDVAEYLCNTIKVA